MTTSLLDGNVVHLMAQFARFRHEDLLPRVLSRVVPFRNSPLPLSFTHGLAEEDSVGATEHRHLDVNCFIQILSSGPSEHPRPALLSCGYLNQCCTFMVIEDRSDVSVQFPSSEISDA